MRNWKVILALLTFSATLMSSSYTMLIPFLPMYLLKELKVPPEQVTLWSGAVFSITFLIGGIMAPYWGKIADKKGKKLMGLRSAMGLSIAYFLGGFVQSPEQLFLVRAFQGFAAGLISIYMALCSASVPQEKLGMSMGILQSGITLGGVIGPLLGGTLSTIFGMRASFYLAGSFMALISSIMYFLIPEPAKLNEKKEERPLLLKERKDVVEVLTYVAIVQFVVLMVQPILTLYVQELNKSSENVVFLSGLIFSLVGIASAFTAPFWGRLGQRKGFFYSLALASLLAGIASASCSLPDNLWTFGAVNFVYGLFFAGVVPSISSTLASITDHDQRGIAFGYMFSAQQFGAMLGPLVGGFLAMWMPKYCIFYVTGSILISMSLVVYKRHLAA